MLTTLAGFAAGCSGCPIAPEHAPERVARLDEKNEHRLLEPRGRIYKDSYAAVKSSRKILLQHNHTRRSEVIKVVLSKPLAGQKVGDRIIAPYKSRQPAFS